MALQANVDQHNGGATHRASLSPVLRKGVYKGNVVQRQHQWHQQVPHCLPLGLWHTSSLWKNQSDCTGLHLSPPSPGPVITALPDPHCKCTCRQCDYKAGMHIWFAFSPPAAPQLLFEQLDLQKQSQRCSKTKKRRWTHIFRVFPANDKERPARWSPLLWSTEVFTRVITNSSLSALSFVVPLSSLQSKQLRQESVSRCLWSGVCETVGVQVKSALTSLTRGKLSQKRGVNCSNWKIKTVCLTVDLHAPPGIKIPQSVHQQPKTSHSWGLRLCVLASFTKFALGAHLFPFQHDQYKQWQTSALLGVTKLVSLSAARTPGVCLNRYWQNLIRCDAAVGLH